MKWGGFFLWLIGIVLVDAITKYTAHFLSDPVWIWPPFVRLEMYENTGVAFSLPLSFFWQIWLSIIFLGILIFWVLFELRGKAEMFFFSLIFGGAVGNLAERILFSRVTDFLAIGFFPVFNLADVALFLGVCGLLFQEWKKIRRKNSTLC